MKLASAVLVVMMSVASVPMAFAHEGHAHRLMGTVAAVQGKHLQVKATTGKTSEVVVNEKTKILRGATALTPTDIKPGDRIVVTMTETKDQSGNATLTAKEIRLGSSAAPRR